MYNMLTNYFGVMMFLPLIGIIFVGAVLYFVLKFYKKENAMPFKDKIKLIRKLIRLVIGLYIAFFIFSILFLIYISGKLDFNMGAFTFELFNSGFAFTVILTIIQLVIEFGLYFLIFKQYLILINNFEKEIIFNEDNVEALRKVAKYALLVIIVDLIFIIIGYLINFVLSYMIATDSIELLLHYFGSDIINNVNVNTQVDLGILIKFIICIAINIVSTVFKKAYDLYEENRLTI